MKKNISENPAAEELLNIEITNLQGKVLLIKNVKQDTPVNIQTLTPGVYFIIITDAAGNKEVKKFVKIH